MNRNAVLGVILVVIVAGVAGWQYWQQGQKEPEVPQVEQVLIVAHTVDADTLDPQISGMMVAGDVFMTIYDSLLVRDEDGVIRPHLAESWEFSEDGRELKLKLREGVTFHSGAPFNAEAVKYNFDRIFDPETASGSLATIQDVVKDVRVTGEYEVALELYEPNIIILDILATVGDFCIDPVEAEKWGVDEFGLHPSGTGPFMFEEWVRDDHITVVRNPDYDWAPEFTGHEGPAKLEKIIFRVIPEPTVRVQSAQTGEIHIAAWPSNQMIEDVRKDPNVKVLEVAGDRIDFFSINVERYPWNITEMRKAVMHGINKEAINTAAAMGLNIVAYSPAAPATMGNWYNDELYEYTNYDPELSASILEEQGWELAEDGWRYKDGQQLTANLVEPSKKYADLLDVALVVKDNLEAIGIKIEFEDLDRDTWYTRTFDGTYDFTAAGLSGANIVGLKWLFSPDQIPWPNWERVNDTDMMYNLEMGMKQTSVEAAEPYFKEFQRIIVDRGYWNPIYHPTVFKVVYKTAIGLKHPPVAGGWIYLDIEITT